jgi:recombinational DNA repair ATPase RecF
LKVLKNRNKVLKNILEKKSTINEIDFWDNAFINISIKYYEYRIKFINFIKNNLDFLENILDKKYSLDFYYETKINLNKIYDSISNYLKENINRDIII